MAPISKPQAPWLFTKVVIDDKAVLFIKKPLLYRWCDAICYHGFTYVELINKGVEDSLRICDAGFTKIPVCCDVAYCGNGLLF